MEERKSYEMKLKLESVKSGVLFIKIKAKITYSEKSAQILKEKILKSLPKGESKKKKKKKKKNKIK